MIRKTPLPHRKLRFHAAREAALNQHHCPLKRDALRRKQQVDMVGMTTNA
jgi:hypothetical protein